MELTPEYGAQIIKSTRWNVKTWNLVSKSVVAYNLRPVSVNSGAVEVKWESKGRKKRRESLAFHKVSLLHSRKTTGSLNPLKRFLATLVVALHLTPVSQFRTSVASSLQACFDGALLQNFLFNFWLHYCTGAVRWVENCANAQFSYFKQPLQRVGSVNNGDQASIWFFWS